MYNGPSVVIHPSVWKLVAFFLSTLKRLKICFFPKQRQFQVKIKSKFKANSQGLRQFFCNKKCFLFHPKSSFRSQDIFLSWLLDHVGQRLDWKDQVNFKIYDVSTWLTKNYNIHLGQYLKK